MRKFLNVRETLVLIVAFAMFGCGQDTTQSTSDNEAPDTSVVPPSPSMAVVVYSSVSPAQIAPVLAAFTAETDIKTELVSDDYAALRRRMAEHGGDPVADLLVAGNVASLANAAETNLLRPIYTPELVAEVAPVWTDPDSYWFPLGVKARVIVYNDSLVSDDEIAAVTNYESLADDSWQQRLCLSSSSLAGNRTLIARLIQTHGKRDAELLVRGWVANMVDGFFKTDEELLRAMLEERCAIAIADTSTLVRFRSADENLPLEIWEIDAATGPLIDVSGAGVTRHAQNPEGAEALLSWMLGAQANALFAASGAEFPIHPGAAIDAVVDSLASTIVEPLPVVNLSMQQEEARLLAVRARYP